MKRIKFDISHLDRHYARGLTEAAYCQAHGIKPATLAYWRSKSKNESLAFVEVSGVTKQRPVDSFKD
jgi:transposase-like protein